MALHITIVDSRNLNIFPQNPHTRYYCTATIEDGKITTLYEETGRDGGVLWGGMEHQTQNGTLRQCLYKLADSFGDEFYKAVVDAAYNESLRSAEQMYRLRTYLPARIRIVKRNMATAKKEYDAARAELRKLEKQMKGV
jgi:hypothetical protein